MFIQITSPNRKEKLKNLLSIETIARNVVEGGSTERIVVYSNHLTEPQGKIKKSDVCSEAVKCLKSGGIVAIPTDTVYGLGTDPFNATAVQRLYTVKGRPDGKPIPLVLSSVTDIYRVAQNLPDFFFHLTDRFWPGGLTIVVESKDLLPVLTAGGSTVGVRIPDNPLLLKILQAFGGPMAITSANLSGEPPATSVQEIGEELASRIDLIVDGGRTPGPIPSTVYDISVSPPLVRRHGVVSEETLTKELACYNKP